jgi:hypothetical protein
VNTDISYESFDSQAMLTLVDLSRRTQTANERERERERDGDASADSFETFTNAIQLTNSNTSIHCFVYSRIFDRDCNRKQADMVTSTRTIDLSSVSDKLTV